ncbi:MAG: RNA methyltransferase [Deltaproteobacteria bacterium]|nr:RNA methyltransferase [Deltaproteobacteria bacterium]
MKENRIRLENLAVVLHRPQLSENIGTAARAAANMGLGKLIVVKPRQLEENIMVSTATRIGTQLILDMTVCEELLEAVEDYQYVVGTTARPGSFRGPFHSPRALARELISISPENRIALIFGPERSGLTTEELRLCQATVTIPTAAPETSSLNLAQAVLLIGYEIMMANSSGAPVLKPRLAPAGELEDMYAHLKKALLDIDFLREWNADHRIMSFKRLFSRTGLTHGDCNLLRGLARRIENMAACGSRPLEDETGERDQGSR